MTRDARTLFPLLQMVPGRVAKVRERLERGCWSDGAAIAVEVSKPDPEGVPITHASELDYRPCPPGTSFARPDDQWGRVWFRLELEAALAHEQKRRALLWDGRGEITVYRDSVPWAGLDVAHPRCPLPDEATTLFLDCGLYQTAIWCPGPEPDQYGFRFDGARVQLRDETTWSAFHRVSALEQLMDGLLEREGFRGDRPSHRYKTPLESISPLLRQLLHRLDLLCDIFDVDGTDGLQKPLDSIYETFRAESWQPKVGLVGHAHLDLVWLWTERITTHKAIHTFSTALRLMEASDDFTFMSSSPTLYEEVTTRSPHMAEEIRRLVDAGRWEATGAFEVEADTLIPVGEALLRSLLEGQKRFSQLRTKKQACTVAWLPDVFGYSHCLPQLFAQTGVRSFFTTKLTWSPINRFPHHSFRWRGPDGSEVLTHLCSTGYNRHLTHADLDGCARDYRQSDVHDEILLPLGYGDGGGGPTESMLERARCFADLVGTPRARWTTAEGFFERLEEVRDELPEYQGELYLETHRGTLTSQGRFKAAYRALERSLQTREAARALLGTGPLGFEAWRRALFAQFHDALPGSSIGEVYDELTPELEQLAKDHLDATVTELQETDSSKETGESGLMLFNPLVLSRRWVVELDEKQAEQLSGKRPTQTLSNGHTLFMVDLEPLSVALEQSEYPVLTSEGSSRKIESGSVRASFSTTGDLAELQASGLTLPLVAPPRFRLYDDHPVSFDAWDIDRHSLGLGQDIVPMEELTLIERGPLRSALEGTLSVGERSELRVRYEVNAGAPFLFVELEIDWQEDHKLLRYEIPTGSRATMARFGGPFGSLERRQVPGREVDEVQWEVAASRWAAVGGDDQHDGLALITEAKYGFSCRDGVLGVSLLRSPRHPDPNCDRGRHRIRFAIGRHRHETVGQELSTAAAGEALFSQPLLVERRTPIPPLVRLGELGSLVPAWTLPAEHSDGFILRLHETMGRGGIATIELNDSPGQEWQLELVDCLERPVKGGLALHQIAYKPYDLLSVLFKPKA